MIIATLIQKLLSTNLIKHLPLRVKGSLLILLASLEEAKRCRVGCMLRVEACILVLVTTIMVDHVATVYVIINLPGGLNVKASFILLQLNAPALAFFSHSLKSLHIFLVFFECAQLLCFDLA